MAMKLILTSAGIKNKTIAKALRDLVGNKMKIAFIPTAANMVDGEKGWLIRDFEECARLGSIDIVDISAMPKKEWLRRLRLANTIVVGGGWTAYLMREITKSGLDAELPELLRNRVYVGISAGSIILSRRLSSSSDFLYKANPNKTPRGLAYVSFNFRPHFNSKDFPKLRDMNLRRLAKRVNGDFYALDDNSAMVWVDGRIKVVSEGKWKLYRNREV